MGRQSQDETARRQTRKKSTAYMDSSRKRGRTTLGDAIEVGARTIERIVGGRYEWKDGSLRKCARTGRERRPYEPG